MLNLVAVSGRLGKEPRIFNAGQDNERINFSIAVDQGRGQNRESHWLDVVMFGKGCSTVHANVEVGQEVHIQGRLQASPKKGKDESGQYDRELWSVVADSFNGVTFGRKKGEGNGNGNGAASQAPAQGPAEDEPDF